MYQAELKKIFQRLSSDLKLEFELVNEIKSGMNNRLFKIKDQTGKNYLLKWYMRDDRQRLMREFTAFSFLRDKGFTTVPIAYKKYDDLDVALYSFEEGRNKTAEELDRDDLREMARFLADLHSITPDQIDIPFPPAVLACFSLQEYLDTINYRLGIFLSYIDSQDVHPFVKRLTHQMNIKKTFKDLLTTVVNSSRADLANYSVSESDRRLCQMDFGPQNIIFKDDGGLCFVDFEYFGFNDPVRIVAEFVMHDRSIAVSEKDKQFFIDAYHEFMNVPPQKQLWTKISGQLTAIEWLSIYLVSLTPEKIKLRKFSDSNFDEDNYLDQQIKKFTDRLSYVEQIIAQ